MIEADQEIEQMRSRAQADLGGAINAAVTTGKIPRFPYGVAGYVPVADTPKEGAEKPTDTKVDQDVTVDDSQSGELLSPAGQIANTEYWINKIRRDNGFGGVIEAATDSTPVRTTPRQPKPALGAFVRRQS